MHSPQALSRDIYWIGVNDRDTDLFEGLWPLPRGVAYNSYLIVDEKVALVDTVKIKTAMPFLDKVREIIGERPVDYLIINHMEPDHSGAIRFVLDEYPNLRLVGNAKTARMLEDFYAIPDLKSRMLVVNDGDTLCTGRHTLTFAFIPMVHWPETMVTYDAADRVLFSMDAFGGFGALDGGVFDDEVDVPYYEDEILRYFSNIVGKYCNMVQKAFEKLKGLDIGVIAPTHGPVWRKNPGTILELYDRWSRHVAEPGVVLVYGSMYGNSERMMEAVARGVMEGGCTTVRIHNVSRSHPSYIIRDAWRYRALAFGAPTYDMEIYPPMDHVLRLLGRKKLRNRHVGLFGTYAWNGGGIKAVQEMVQNYGWRVAEPVIEARCAPSAETLDQCRALGRALAEKTLAGQPEPV